MTHMHTGRQGVSVANIDFLVIAKKKIKDEKKNIAEKCYFEILHSKSGHFWSFNL